MGESRTQPKKEFSVRVDPQRCKGCGICVALCPKQVLVLKVPEMKCEVVRVKDCIGCLMCEMHCPDFAILCEPNEPAGVSENSSEKEPEDIQVKT